MKNRTIGARAAEDLEGQVRKVLRGLEDPEPPLNLDHVRALQKLDLQYYSSADDSWLRQLASQIRVAGKQILRRPTLLLEAVRKAELSALYLPDQRRILLDLEAPELKHRWNQGHEIGHSLAPWHEPYLFGDDSASLHPSCHDTLEAEANFVSGRLLSLGNRFSEEAIDLEATIDTVFDLAKKFGNTKTGDVP